MRRPPQLGHIRGPCTRTGPADRDGSWSTGTSRSPPPDSRTPGSRETPAPQSAASPGHRACRRPGHERFRSDRAPVDAGHPARAGAADRRRRRWPRRQEAQGPCLTSHPCSVNDLRGGPAPVIAATAFTGMRMRRSICYAGRVTWPAPGSATIASRASCRGRARTQRTLRRHAATLRSPPMA